MDKERLLRSLNDHSVEYVIIGALAFPIHGYARSTLDIDIFIRPDRANAELTHQALADSGFDVHDLSVDDLLDFKILIRQYIVEVDVHPYVAGISFDAVWASRVAGRFGQVDVNYAGLDALIEMKRAAGRPKDLADLKALEKIRARP